MPIPASLLPVTLVASIALVSLAACRPQSKPQDLPPAASSDAKPEVAPSADLRGASDHADAPPAVGALTAGQAKGGARSAPTQPTGGDGTRAGAASSPASGVSTSR